MALLKSRMRFAFTFVCLIAALGLNIGAAQAQRLASDKVKVKTYRVKGTSLAQLRNYMDQNGPNGFWALTETNWRWDGRCNMRFSATVTMPKLANRRSLDAAELREWDRMIAVLRQHEYNHVAIGRGWAMAIKAANCDEAAVAKINREWGSKDAAYDRHTDHGYTEGVYLGK